MPAERVSFFDGFSRTATSAQSSMSEDATAIAPHTHALHAS